jgi:hypothetical protein
MIQSHGMILITLIRIKNEGITRRETLIKYRS